MLTRLLLAVALLLLTAHAHAQAPWPAEAVSDAVNLTPIEGPGANDFHNDLSGAFWNPQTRTLWLVRNGPAGNSKMWAVVEDGLGGFQIDQRGGARGEWTNFGDLEGVTQADLGADRVILIIEGEERIKEYDVSSYGTAILLNDWDTSALLPRAGGSGSEGITFVPDFYLSRAGFVDPSGALYTSTQGMGGLIFVGHQNGGSIFVFDLNRADGSFLFVGEYRTSQTETAGLEFDRSTGFLYAYHDRGIDILSVMDLTSSPSSGTGPRTFNTLASFAGPANENNEGIAVVPASECQADARSFFLTTDDGAANSLRWYRSFTHGCEGTSIAVPSMGRFGLFLLASTLSALGVRMARRRQLGHDARPDTRATA